MITGKTRLTGLLGSPVAHSISPLMHNQAFQLLGLDYAYLCFDVSEAQLPETVKALIALNARGFNCTMPDKIRMCELADQLSPAAEMMGSVNTVVIDDGVLTGHNTDGAGYMASAAEAGVRIKDKKITLLGGGGAATAIAVQAALDGAAALSIFCRQGRSWPRAQQLVDTICQKTGCQAALFDLADLTSLRQQLSESVLLTNATSAGMAPDTASCPIADLSVLHEDLTVSDIIYNPRETRLLSEARARGCKTFNGLYMLLYQGAAAFRLWTGCEMPVEEIKKTCFS